MIFIAYRHTTPTSFQGLTRGLYLSRGMKTDDGAEGNDTEDQVRFKAGELVADGRAWKITFHPIWSVLGTNQQGRLNDFDSISSLKNISDWDYGSLRLALQLLEERVSIDDLKGMGLLDSLSRIGVDPVSVTV